MKYSIPVLLLLGIKAHKLEDFHQDTVQVLADQKVRNHAAILDPNAADDSEDLDNDEPEDNADLSYLMLQHHHHHSHHEKPKQEEQKQTSFAQAYDFEEAGGADDTKQADGERARAAAFSAPENASNATQAAFSAPSQNVTATSAIAEVEAAPEANTTANALVSRGRKNFFKRFQNQGRRGRRVTRNGRGGKRLTRRTTSRKTFIKKKLENAARVNSNADGYK